MVEVNATVIKLENDNHVISIDLDNSTARIPLSDDKPIAVKTEFNKLIIHLKKGIFQIKLKEGDDDLFYQVAKEYITQLNKEIQEVHGEMVSYGLANVK